MSSEGIISVLCPTRARPGPLACTMRMLRHLAARPERLEILLYVDDDDPIDYRETWERFSARGAPLARGRILRGPRKYYSGLNECFNALAKGASGRWCMVWNDDIFMATKDWDLALDAVPGEIAVAMTESNHGRSPCTFPFFTKSYAEILGHVSLNTHTDTWIEEVGKAAGVAVDVPILVLHAYLEDELARSGKARIEEGSASYYTAEMAASRAQDARKLREQLGK